MVTVGGVGDATFLGAEIDVAAHRRQVRFPAFAGGAIELDEFVLGQEGAPEFVERVAALMEPVVAGYVREGRRYATVAVGCTGGKHRSVAVAEALRTRLTSDDVATFVVHRDLGQE